VEDQNIIKQAISRVGDLIYEDIKQFCDNYEFSKKEKRCIDHVYKGVIREYKRLYPEVFWIYPPEYRKIRKEILARDKNICQLCGNFGNYVHHIDYNKHNSNGTNLITVCRDCNTKANYKRNFYMKYFRNVLRERGLVK